MRRRHVNIPVFIPHLGCPNTCVFCNQHVISGTCSFQRERIASVIEGALSTVNPETTDCEIAFFGGSFTGIDRETMVFCLNTAESYVKSGRVSGIRMSTRPDYIDAEILDLLEAYTVSEIELGIQSVSDRVLLASERGHTAEDTVRACALLRKRRIPFVGQMMIGLPASTPEDEVVCAEAICAMGAAGSRIYPTVVFRGTTLATMTAAGAYRPLDLSEAVDRSAAALDVFVRRGVRCLRVGLCESEQLHGDEYCAGPNHPAMGELVGNALYLRRMCEVIEGYGLDFSGREAVFSVPRGDISLAVGQGRGNILKIQQKYHIKSLRFLENSELIRYNIVLNINH